MKMLQPDPFLRFEADGIRIEIKKAVTFQKEVKAAGGVEAKITLSSGRVESANLTYDTTRDELLYPNLRDFDYSEKWKKDYWPRISGAFKNLYINGAVKKTEI